MESSQIIAIIFKIINFMVLIWIGKYVFEKYLLPSIKEKINKKNRDFDSLEKKNFELISQSNLLNQEIVDQEKLFENLKEKIEIWNKKTETEQEKKNLEFLELSQKHEKKLLEQTNNLHTQKLLDEIFPRVIAGTYRQMEQKFSQEQEAEKFFRNILNYMENNSGQNSSLTDKR